MTAGFRQVSRKCFGSDAVVPGPRLGIEGKDDMLTKGLHLGKATLDFQTRMIEKKAGNLMRYEFSRACTSQGKAFLIHLLLMGFPD